MTSVNITDLTPYPHNPRRGNTDLIAESLQNLGQYRPIVVNRGTKTSSKTPNIVLAGNHTLRAAQQLGWETIDVHEVDVDDETARRIVLVDNRANDKSGYDIEELTDLLAELPDYTATGYTQADYDRLIDGILDNTPDPVAAAQDASGDGQVGGDEGTTAAPEDDDEDDPEPGTQYNTRTEIPHYEPSGDPPALTDIIDATKTEDLRARIAAADIPDDVKAFLHEAAHRHTRIDYQRAADYYAHAPAPVQRLMEQQALVIPDIGDAIREGYVRTSDRLRALLGDEYPDEYDPAQDRTAA